MSTSFFIGPINPSVWYEEMDIREKPTSDLKIDPDFYRSELLKKWPFANVYKGNGESYSLSWTLDSASALGPKGGLQADCQHVDFRYAESTFSDFVLWHRALIPSDYVLYLFNSSSSPTHLVLKQDVTPNDIEHYLNNS